ncbi:Hypothetical protein ARAMI_47 [Enterococcus phage Aramis]|uniref:Uncharacterized protein n=1 Tax=Enterococcus phage Aramis TaxID=2795668 RepID=A0A8D6UBL6_9CAUD|nr:Hypothetical protein ARAMI_47 [Enterococcus phage Aramis]
MKKKYKGYFKKPTRTLPDVKFKKQVIKSFNFFNFTEKPRIGLWVNTYLKYLNKL